MRFFATMVRWLAAQYEVTTVRCFVSISVAIQNAVQDAFAIKVNYRSCPCSQDQQSTTSQTAHDSYTNYRYKSKEETIQHANNIKEIGCQPPDIRS